MDNTNQNDIRAIDESSVESPKNYQYAITRHEDSGEATVRQILSEIASTVPSLDAFGRREREQQVAVKRATRKARESRAKKTRNINRLKTRLKKGHK